ncbi:MAG: hypothetical protein UW28_C0021G0013 [Parcubacteria group bacterium GW2011_GWA2_44_13]|nr:MAG: hypothetical protein UW28_C0021G0013 [Parcubacteria group bacterium GW2011_GWA2_44_13]
MLNKQNLPSKIKVGDRWVGEGEPNFIIAEIGNNHNGEIDLARKAVTEAARLGADAVKFQKREIDEVFTKAMQAVPQTNSRALGKTYGEYRKKQELKDEELKEMKILAHSLGMAFFVTPFDLKIFFSTGMANDEEVDSAVNTILKYNNQLIINHCVSIYPTPDADLNLGAVVFFKEKYSPLPIGYSGHEIGFIPTIAAVALGACTVERHFTLDKSLPGPDHSTVSLDPPEFGEMVHQIRRIEKAVADKKKYLHEKEIGIRNKHGKSIVSKTAIPFGTLVTKDMLTCKSPGNGLKPTVMDKVIGSVARVDIPEDTVLTEEMIIFS